MENETCNNESSIDNLSSQKRKLIQIAQEINEVNAEKSGLVGFVCRSMVTASLPHSKITSCIYKRKCNKFTLTINGNEEAGGIPYGVYPRLILTWISSSVVKHQEREIILGESLSNFMSNLGLSVTGGRWGTITRFKEQLKKLFGSERKLVTSIL